MRIIGGESRGRKLRSLEGRDTRPTLDRVKEAMFSMAQPWIYGAAVLDLFGGSGALGLEAVSRGAEKAYINDSSKNAVNIIRENVSTLGYEEKVEIFQLNWKDMLKKALQEGAYFDIIILDPPYVNDYIYTCVEECKKLLCNDGVIIVEHDGNTVFEENVLKAKSYGTARLTFLS